MMTAFDLGDAEMMKDPKYRAWLEERMEIYKTLNKDLMALITAKANSRADVLVALDVLFRVQASMWISAHANFAKDEQTIDAMRKGVLYGLDLVKQLVESDTPMTFGMQHWGRPIKVK